MAVSTDSLFFQPQVETTKDPPGSRFDAAKFIVGFEINEIPQSPPPPPTDISTSFKTSAGAILLEAERLNRTIGIAGVTVGVKDGNKANCVFDDNGAAPIIIISMDKTDVTTKVVRTNPK
jgi:hypothetical protein